MSYWQGRIQLLRPGNGLMVIIAVWLGIASTQPNDSHWWFGLLAAVTEGADVGLWFAAPLAAFFINGFGNTLNDIVDRDIDKVAHPHRPLPSGTIGIDDARRWAVLVLGIGLVEAYIGGGWVLMVFAAVNATLLGMYEWKLKALPIVGNLLIAALVASAFAFGAVAAGTTPTDWSALWWLMAMVGLVNIAREVLKDLEDAGADSNRRTLPQVIGATAASWTASSLVGLAVGLDLALAWLRTDWSLAGRIVLAAAGLAFIVASGMGCYRAGLGQRALKWAMVTALIGFAMVF